MGEQYKQLQFRDRLKIEARLNIGYKPKQIAADLGVHVSTIYREVKRGTYTHMNSDLTTDIRYSPEIAEARYQESLSAKGAPLKIGKNHAVAAFIEDKIINDDYSPAAVCALLHREEFADADGIARSAINAEEKRTALYYCHAYCSCERGTNENINRMIRRRFPKGTDFEAVTDADVARVENWINNYPREILGFQSSAQMFSAAFAAAA